MNHGDEVSPTPLMPDILAKPGGGHVKHDQGKLPFHLLPYDALTEVVKVLQFGASKYAERGWEAGFDWHRIFGAAMRHVTSWWMGEDLDPESGLHHLAHFSCDALFLLTYVLRKVGKDDRELSRRPRLDGSEELQIDGKIYGPEITGGCRHIWTKNPVMSESKRWCATCGAIQHN